MTVLRATLLLLACGAIAFSESVEPEYLDSLLASKNYDEFARLMGIKDVELVKPEPANSDDDPMFNKGLFSGDILLTSEDEEKARQGIRFERYGGSKWQSSQVPFTISTEFSSTNVRRIQDAVAQWNRQVRCVKWVDRKSERDYVQFFPGRGCYSYLGRIGDQQALSLQQNGCFRQGTILHEMDHAIGFAHEHNRNDRDDYIEILWDNIPDDWKDQYKKTNPRDFGLQRTYDYYSVMHYPVPAPGTNKPAFRVKQNGIDERRIGQRDGFTQTDLDKINMQYC